VFKQLLSECANRARIYERRSTLATKFNAKMFRAENTLQEEKNKRALDFKYISTHAVSHFLSLIFMPPNSSPLLAFISISSACFSVQSAARSFLFTAEFEFIAF
jgi:hypothetical protein